MNFGEWGTLGVSFLWMYLRLSESAHFYASIYVSWARIRSLRIKKNPGSKKYHINHKPININSICVIFRVIELELHNVTGQPLG